MSPSVYQRSMKSEINIAASEIASHKEPDAMTEPRCDEWEDSVTETMKQKELQLLLGDTPERGFDDMNIAGSP